MKITLGGELLLERRGWASSRIANPLSLKANLNPTGLAKPVSNPSLSHYRLCPRFELGFGHT